MKTPPFEYHSPTEVDEVLDLLTEHGDEAKLLAGGQSLMPLLAMRLARPSHLIDLNRISGLDSIDDVGDRVSFGTMVRERAAESSELVREKVPVLAAALPYIGHVAIRNRGTIGGSLAHGDASSELPAVALVTEAEMVLRSATGERTVSAADFFQGHFTTALNDEELLIEVSMPSTPARTGWSCIEIARRPGDFALVGAAAMIRLDGTGTIAEGRVALFGVADTARRMSGAESTLAGVRPSEEVLRAAAADAASDLHPASDVHGSGSFRRRLAEVVVRRALTAAAAQAGGE
jgi:carbon-monoxide dehydrogenase medium subunit